MEIEKKKLRSWIREKKKMISPEQLRDMSDCLLEKLEQHPRFVAASCVLLYYSLPDEVYTHAFVEKWSRDKVILLPLVRGERLTLCQYTGKCDLRKGEYGIWEPSGALFQDYGKIDLAIIPGMGFDKQGNRLGRGKGYYDRLLPQLNSYNVGICFGFQLFQHIPAGNFDIPMHEVWTEEGCVSEN